MTLKEEVASLVVQTMLKSLVGKNLGDVCMNIDMKIDRGNIDLKIRPCKPET